MSKKTLSERLEAQKTGKPNNRVVFLLHKEEIAQAMEKGFTIKNIHQVMLDDGNISIGYSSFARLVNTHILQKPVKSEKQQHRAESRGKFLQSNDNSKWRNTKPIEEAEKIDPARYMNYPKGYKKEETPKK